jgi:GNAT superfamily N-acetyltransferase
MNQTLSTSALRWASRSRVVALRDGGEVVLRGARPQDAEPVAAMHLRCSLETTYGRYFTLLPRVSRRWQQALLSTDVALVAVLGRDVVALGNLAAGPGGEVELALLVEDAQQGRGLGTVLAAQLAATARLLGHRSVRLEILPGAPAAQRLVGRLGPVAVRRSHSVVELEVRLGLESLRGLGDPIEPLALRAG